MAPCVAPLLSVVPSPKQKNLPHAFSVPPQVTPNPAARLTNQPHSSTLIHVWSLLSRAALGLVCLGDYPMIVRGIVHVLATIASKLGYRRDDCGQDTPFAKLGSTPNNQTKARFESKSPQTPCPRTRLQITSASSNTACYTSGHLLTTFLDSSPSSSTCIIIIITARTHRCGGHPQSRAFVGVTPPSSAPEINAIM